MKEILNGYATEMEANKQQARLTVQKDKGVWDMFASAAIASVARCLPDNCCANDIVGEQCAHAAAIADRMLEERKKRYGSIES